ncbi:MAG: VTT domain-containing protein [archaeon]
MKLFSSKEARNKFLKVLIIIIIVLAITYYLGSHLFTYFKDVNHSRETIQSFGVYGPLMMIGLLVVILLLAFISQMPLIIAGGYAFGAIPATAYALIAFFIGGTIAFYLARWFGRPFVKRIITKSAMEKFDNYSGLRLDITLFSLFLVPLFPDAMCYVAGLTNIKYKTFVLISVLGRLPAVLLFAFAGNSLASMHYVLGIILFGVILVCGAIILIFQKRIENHVVSRFEKK